MRRGQTMWDWDIRRHGIGTSEDMGLGHHDEELYMSLGHWIGHMDWGHGKCISTCQ